MFSALKISQFGRNQSFSLIKSTNLLRLLSNSTKNNVASDDHTSKSEKFQVYYGSLTPNIRAVKMFSLTTSIGGIIAQPVLYNQAIDMGSSTGIVVAVCGFVGFFTFVTPFLLHLITKKYVTELDYNPSTNEYTATVISFFLRKKLTTFKPEDVHVPDVPGMFTSFMVGKKGLFVDPKLFEDPQHYVKIMGYDKPLDFKMELTEKEADKK
ncbi:unnamed protein product [Diamesa serratosioi]